MTSETTPLVMPLLCSSADAADSQHAAAEAAIRGLTAWLEFCETHHEVVLIVCAPEAMLPLLLAASDVREPLRRLASEGRIQFGTWAAPFDGSRVRAETVLSALNRARAIVGGLLGAQAGGTTAMIAGVRGDSASLLAATGATVILEAGSPTTSAPLCQVVAANGARLWRCRIGTAATEVGIKAVEIDPHVAPADTLQAVVGTGTEATYGGLDRARERVIQAAERMWVTSPVIAGPLEREPATNSDLHAAVAVAENVLIDAERLAAVAAVSGTAARPDLELDRGWRQALYGMGVAATSKPPQSLRCDALAACQEAAEIGTRVVHQATDALARRIEVSARGGGPRDTRVVLVTNPLGYSRTDLVQVRLDWDTAATGLALTDQRGKPVRHQLLRSGQHDDGRRWADVCFVAEEVPALGWRTYFARPAAASPAEDGLRETAEAVIENAFLRVTASLAAGGVTSITDRSARRQVLRDGIGCRLVDGGSGETLTATGMYAQTGPLLSRIVFSGDDPRLGRWHQTLSLWTGIQRLDAEVVFERDAGARPIRMLWHLASPGRVPVWGTDRGVWAGALEQSRPLRNWLDLSHAALLRHGRTAHALGPCAIIAPRSLQVPARELLAALAAAGVPGRGALPDEAPDLGPGTSHVLLGGPRDNDQTAALFEREDGRVRDRFQLALERSGLAIALFVGPAGRASLVAAARDSERLSQLVASWTSSLAQGEIALPRDTVVAGEPPTAEHDGVAIIGDGSLTARVSAEGEVAMEMDAGRAARFALVPHRGDWRSARLHATGDALAHSLCAVAVPPPSGGLTAVSAPVQVKGDVILTGLRLPTGGAAALRPNTPTSSNTMLVSLVEARGRDQEIKIASAWPLVSAWRCDSHGERQSELALTRDKDVALRLGPHEAATTELTVDAPAPPGPEESAPTADEINPTPVRYWEWGLGAAPLASAPVAACLHGQPGIGETTRFTLTVVNNQLDDEARGAVCVSAPEGWRLTPAQVPYRLPPGGQHTYEVAVIIPPEEPPGTVTAEVEWRGRRFADWLVIGDWQPLECSLERRGGQVVARIANPNSREVSGVVAIITTADNWLRGAGGGYHSSPVTPVRQAFVVPPDGSTELCFDWWGDSQEAIPVAAKVMYHRRADYIALGEDPSQ